MKSKLAKHLLSWIWSLIPLTIILSWIEPSVAINLLIVTLASITFIIVSFQNKRIDKKWTKYLIVLIVLFLLFQIDKSSNITRGVITIITTFLIAYPILFGKLFIYPSKLILYLFTLYLLTATSMGLIEVDAFFKTASNNLLSVIGVFMAITVNLKEVIQGKKPSLLPSLAALSISVIGISRSGVISSGLYFTGVYLLLYWRVSLKHKIYFAFLLGGLIVLAYINIHFIQGMDFYSKFQQGQLESFGRNDLWSEYLNNINLFTFIYGYDYSQNSLFIDYNNNPHNSWIAFHSQMGVFSIYIFLELIRSVFKYLRNNKFISIFITVILIRTFTDTVLFYGMFDYIIIAFYFIAKDSRLKHKLKENEYG